MADDDPARYGWWTDQDLSSVAEAGCVTVVTSTDKEHVLGSFGASKEDVTSDSAAEETESLRTLLVGQLEHATVIVEDNGFEGSRAEVIGPASRHGKAASVFWNVNGLVIFTCASRGKVKSSVELPTDDASDLPRSLASLAGQLQQAGAHPAATGMALVEKFTAVVIDRTDVLRADTHAITSPVVALPLTAEELVGMDYPSPQLVQAVLQGSVARARSIAEWAAVQALHAVGLDEDPRITAVTAGFHGAEPPSMTAAAETFVARISRDAERAEWEAVTSGQGASLSPGPGRQHWSGVALRYATQRDHVCAALGAVYAAMIAVGREQEGAHLLAEAERRIEEDPAS